MPPSWKPVAEGDYLALGLFQYVPEMSDSVSTALKPPKSAAFFTRTHLTMDSRQENWEGGHFPFRSSCLFRSCAGIRRVLSLTKNLPSFTTQHITSQHYHINTIISFRCFRHCHQSKHRLLTNLAYTMRLLMIILTAVSGLANAFPRGELYLYSPKGDKTWKGVSPEVSFVDG